jgi:hypothetical protein
MNQKTINHPICFGNVKIGPRVKKEHKKCLENKFYEDKKFSPELFYKQITIL